MIIRLIKPLILTALTVVFLAGEGSVAGDSNPDRMMDSLTSVMMSVNDQPSVIDSSFSLDDYLDLAAERSPALKSAFYNWKAAIERSDYAGALPDPLLSYGYFIENIETRTGPQNQRIGLRQSFPWFGTLGTRKEMASKSADAAYQQFESERLKLLYRVKSAYYDYYFLARDIDITRANLELMVI